LQKTQCFNHENEVFQRRENTFQSQRIYTLIIILTPILLPIATQVGVDPIHFGVIMTVNLAIGFCTPPLGANLFIATGVAEVKLEDLIRKIVPFIITMIVMLMMVTFIPGLSMWLPSMMD